MKAIDQVLDRHFNGKPSEMHYGCNKWVHPIHAPKKKRPEPNGVRHPDRD